MNIIEENQLFFNDHDGSDGPLYILRGYMIEVPTYKKSNIIFLSFKII